MVQDRMENPEVPVNRKICPPQPTNPMTSPISRSNRQASLKMIAEQVGVSLMTVSRTLRGRGRVAHETAEKIRKVAEKLRYRPNRLVLGIRTGRTNLFSAVLPTPIGFYEGALRSIEESLDSRGCSLILNLVAGHFGRDAMREEIRRLHRCIELRVDGIILRPVNDNANAIYFSEAIERQIPLVVIDRRLPDFTSDFVGTDEFTGGETAARQLISRNCRNLMLLHTGDSVSCSRGRKNGFLKVAADAGIPVLSIDCGDFEASPEFLAMAFRQPDAKGIDGVFAITDSIADKALQVLEDLGKPCPDQVKLVGFGRCENQAPLSRRIASFDQHIGVIGTEAVELLMERLSNPSRPFRSILIPATFVEGDTI